MVFIQRVRGGCFGTHKLLTRILKTFYKMHGSNHAASAETDSLTVLCFIVRRNKPLHNRHYSVEHFGSNTSNFHGPYEPPWCTWLLSEIRCNLIKIGEIPFIGSRIICIWAISKNNVAITFDDMGSRLYDTTFFTRYVQKQPLTRGVTERRFTDESQVC